MRIRIFVTTSFEGFHRWPEAPGEVAFLRDRHRHVFHVRAELAVSGHDREVEFILLKRRVDAEVRRQLKRDAEVETWSCERWAKHLLETLNLTKVEVSEDGENGAGVEKD